jgi:ubiquinone/menaquinone biosynthesis C-methylase UbiE
MMDRKALAAAYDRSATTYDARFQALQEVKYRAALPWLPALPEGALCLDAGGGTGLFQAFLQERNHPLARARWLLLDLSLGMLRAGRGRSPLLVAADLSHPPLRPSSVALAVAFTSLLEDQRRTLRQMQLLLVPGGSLVASFLAPEAKAALAEVGSLRHMAGPVEAGQDQLYVFRKV